MSGNELQRIEILAEVLSRRRTEASAATILGISTRQTPRLVVACRTSGEASVIHKGRGRASNNRLLEGTREYAVELVRSNYADFGPSLAAEMLLTKHDLKVSRETLRKWMTGLSRKQRRSFGRVKSSSTPNTASTPLFAKFAKPSCLALNERIRTDPHRLRREKVKSEQFLAAGLE
jgi:hypothetical protein